MGLRSTIPEGSGTRTGLVFGMVRWLELGRDIDFVHQNSMLYVDYILVMSDPL